MRVHLIDGTFELFRAHFAKRPPHVSPDGKDLKATVGVVESLLWLLEDPSEAVTHVAVAFDNPIESFRNRLYDGYKTSEGVPAELMAQFDDVEEAVAALGIVVWSMKEFEADDALATGAARFRALPEVDQVRIMTPDKDLAQCLVGERVVQVDRMRRRIITEATLLADKRLVPALVPSFLGLVGDAADGIPGLPGWGEKGTATVLAAYGRIEDVPRHAREWKVRPPGAERMAAALAAHPEQARLYRTLAKLRTDAPLEEDLAALEWSGVPRARFAAWCAKSGATGTMARVKRWR